MAADLFSKNRLVFFILFITGILSILLGRARYRFEIFELASNDLYPPSSFHYLKQSPISPESLLSLGKEGFISEQLNDHMRGIYFSKNGAYQLPLISGRFFVPQDFIPGNHVVVLGKSWQKNIVVKNSIPYLTYDQIEYQVLGIIGLEQETPMDSMVIFNLIDILPLIPKKTEIVLGHEVDLSSHNVITSKYTQPLTPLSVPNQGISRIWGANRLYKTISYALSLCAIATLSMCIILKGNYYIHYAKVFKLLGFPSRFLVTKIFLPELLISCFFYFFGAFLFYFSVAYKDYPMEEFLCWIKTISPCFFLFTGIFSYYIFAFNIKKNALGGEK